jgi:uncharacterized membrane protein HdeD (DUF308 family)
MSTGQQHQVTERPRQDGSVAQTDKEIHHMLTTLAAQNWGMFVLRGILALTLGVLAFVAPGPTLAALIFVFAAYAIVDGILAIGLGVASPTGPRWLLVVGGILGIVIGVYTVVSPQVTATALVLLIGSFAIVRGIAETATAVMLRSVIDSPWLYVLSGVVSIVFGAYLIVSPGEGAFAVLFVIGFYALFAGVTYIALGLRLRSVNKALETTSATAAGSAS